MTAERKAEQRCGRPGCACTCHMAESERARYLLSGAMPFGAEVCICPLPTESETEREGGVSAKHFDALVASIREAGAIRRGEVEPSREFLLECPAPSETPSPEVGMREELGRLLMLAAERIDELRDNVCDACGTTDFGCDLKAASGEGYCCERCDEALTDRLIAASGKLLAAAKEQSK